MNIIVCIKQVPDTATLIKIGPDGKSIDTAGVKFVLNFYDEMAVEEAVRIKEKNPDTTVTVISAGPDRVQESIRVAMAMGADKGVHIKDLALENSDLFGYAKVLAKAISQTPCDLVLCGARSVDEDLSGIGPLIAELLGIPVLPFANKVDIQGGKAMVQLDADGAKQTAEADFPVVITAQRGLNDPRYPSLPSIIQAKKKEIKTVSLPDLGLSPQEMSPRSQILKLELPPAKPPGKMIKGEPEEMVRELVRLLKDEARVI